MRTQSDRTHLPTWKRTCQQPSKQRHKGGDGKVRVPIASQLHHAVLHNSKGLGGTMVTRTNKGGKTKQKRRENEEQPQKK